MNKPLNLIIISLCVLLIIFNAFYYIKLTNLESDIKSLKESSEYLESAVETISAINAIPNTKNNKARITNKLPLTFDNNEETERRIQALEIQNRQQQNKLNDVERDAYWTRSELNNQKLDKGQLYKWGTDKENQLLNP